MMDQVTKFANWIFLGIKNQLSKKALKLEKKSRNVFNFS